MKTELKIVLTSDDCKNITTDLKNLIENTSGLNRETYLLYQKIKGFVCGYDDIEK